MRLGYPIAALVFILDQLSKYWILEVVRLPEIGSMPVLPVFSLTFVQNPGVSMGLFTADSDLQRWLLVAATGAIAIAVAVWITREKHRWDVAALGLVLGGAAGNILDRARFGYVVDFLHVFWREWSFWVFNIADAAITIGVLMLLGRALLPNKDQTHA
ncbi:lipoprotein signal peptidase [Polymorphobacter multimanifer]|uniref:Lipoprotein signal peptidase n=1 Tax=Polymorphobacter multimanifer TaxID=1070431 RepID=A0A841LEK4_9SPHN|nr:signal peptidase II [Polymorphobacter multimanifer]MBB6228245.1 signal peptidase II [Polymorphobacter multimanifer]GGI85897.1 lipoprotein signal peptidase [Polymorphobacter multimanifer]